MKPRERRRAADRALPGATLGVGAGLGATAGILVAGTGLGLILGGGVGAVDLIAGEVAGSVLTARRPRG